MVNFNGSLIIITYFNLSLDFWPPFFFKHTNFPPLDNIKKVLFRSQAKKNVYEKSFKNKMFII